MDYNVLAYYLFTPIELPAREVFNHKKFLNYREATGRIYISEEGINGQMSAPPSVAKEYMEWLQEDSRFANIEFKIHTWHEHCFPRMTIKVRQQLAALDRKVDMEKTGKHICPEEWKRMLEERDEETVLIDVRNDYEWDIGHFEGAELPALGKFRDFPAYAQRLREKRDPKKTKVMMYCTGGIRCELYSALMREEGFEHIYQLQGGVIKYGLQEGSKHWRGKLFVFDDRLAIPISSEETEMIGTCCLCAEPTDFYFNCANMDCNNLFLSCQGCAETMKGCCCGACAAAPLLRPFVKQERPKPFRRKHLCGISS